MSHALTRDLHSGWNLISMPVATDSEAASYIRTHIDGVFYKIWGYDGEWKKYNPYIDNNPLKVIKKNSAFWIKVGPNGAQLTIDESPKINPLTIKSTGWHLSSFNQTTKRSFKSEVFKTNSIKSSHSLSNVTKIWGFDQSWKSLRPNDGTGSLLNLEPGMGYWIKAVNAENLISTSNPLMIDPSSVDSNDATTSSTFDVKISGSVIDSLSLAPVGLFTTRVLQLSVLGDNQNLVYPSPNSQTNQFTSTDGQFEFWIRAISASLSNKKNLRLIIEENKDYLSTSASFTIASSQEIQLEVPMVNLNSNFQASGIATNKVSLDIPISGILGSAVTLVTSSTNVEGQVEIVVPAGVQMSDKDGNVLTGPLELQSTYFSPTETSSLNAFPGGLNNINIEVDGEKKQGYFISGGFTAIEILDQNKTHVKSFSQPISVKMEVPSSTINPETGVPLKANDQFPIWSYAPETGQWTSEGFGLAMGPNAKNNFEVTFQTDHLSYYNLDWFSDEMCDGSIEFNVIGDEPDLQGTKGLEGYFYKSNGGLKKQIFKMVDGKVDPLNFVSASRGIPFEYVVEYSGYEVGRYNSLDFCLTNGNKIDLHFEDMNSFLISNISVETDSDDTRDFHILIGSKPTGMKEIGVLKRSDVIDIGYKSTDLRYIYMYPIGHLRSFYKIILPFEKTGPIIFDLTDPTLAESEPLLLKSIKINGIDVTNYKSNQELLSLRESLRMKENDKFFLGYRYGHNDLRNVNLKNSEISYQFEGPNEAVQNIGFARLEIGSLGSYPIELHFEKILSESRDGVKSCKLTIPKARLEVGNFEGDISHAGFFTTDNCRLSVNVAKIIQYLQFKKVVLENVVFKRNDFSVYILYTRDFPIAYEFLKLDNVSGTVYR